ncbi:maleylpyruvate isomerase family mycothiol-dependent enzyme [Sphaerisporangium rhizosphaerae]|uniref:Maleylpyruvate isomerase family mycothiol-dependent enzyme n=1 Tax=Sphaerisporangium rhizosphaerae TaxID=2269375 RepID=A0ABW2NYQ0_9ACTN
MTDRADEMITALRSGLDDLAGLVRGFTADDLARRSGASEWDVSQVLSHLGSGAEIFLATIDGALSGAGAPDGDFIKSIWARWDGRSRAERAEHVVGANEALVSRLEGLDRQTKDELRIPLWFPAPPRDVAGLTGMRLTEFAYHTWDVKVAFDQAATLEPWAVAQLLDEAGVLLGFTGSAGELDGQAAIAVRLTSPERSFGLGIDDAVSLTDVPGAPDGVLSAPAEWWLRLVAGRHAPEHTPAEVSLDSEKITLDDLRRVFPGF